jgi:hypothetical protein
MTVLVYVNASKQVATPTISRSLQIWTLPKRGWRKTTPKGWRSNMRFWSEPDRPPQHHVCIAVLAVICNFLGQ